MVYYKNYAALFKTPCIECREELGEYRYKKSQEFDLAEAKL